MKTLKTFIAVFLLVGCSTGPSELFGKESSTIEQNSGTSMHTENLGKNKLRIVIETKQTCTVTVILDEKRSKEYVKGAIAIEIAKCYGESPVEQAPATKENWKFKDDSKKLDI